jgi:hypothetical protein
MKLLERLCYCVFIYFFYSYKLSIKKGIYIIVFIGYFKHNTYISEVTMHGPDESCATPYIHKYILYA